MRKRKILLAPYQSAKDCISGFERGGRVVGLTKGQFSLIHLVRAVLDYTGPADVIISTWSAGFYDAMEVGELMRSGLLRSVKIITDRSFLTRQTNYAASITEVFGPENIRTTNTHAKFVLIGNDEWRVCIRSSMNLNENKRCENFDLDDDGQIYATFEAFCQDVFTQMPEGFISERGVVDPAFDALMGGHAAQRPAKKKLQILNKRGEPLFSEL